MTKIKTKSFNWYKWAPLFLIGLVVFAAGIIALTTLISSARSYSTPEKAWESYLDAINDNDIEGYAKAFYDKGTEDYNRLIADETIINEINMINEATTATFTYNEQYNVEITQNRIAEIVFTYVVNEEPYSMTMTMIFFYQNNRWYMTEPD